MFDPSKIRWKLQRSSPPSEPEVIATEERGESAEREREDGVGDKKDWETGPVSGRVPN